MGIEKVEKAISLMSDAIRLLNSGPLDYYLRKLVAAYNHLIEKHAPFKVGDRVALVAAPDYNKAPGWRHCAHFLVPGAKATVQEVEFTEKGFRFAVLFDDESWIDDRSGTINLLQGDSRHQFILREKDLRLLEYKG